MLCRCTAAIVLSFAATGPRAQESVSLLDRATERAVAYESAVSSLTCDETVKRWRYKSNGEASAPSDLVFAVSLRTDRDGESSGRESSRAPSALRGYPPVTMWLRLFHPEMRAWMLIHDEDPVEPTDGSGHRFSFRGAFPRDRGEDIREWQGMAWVNPRTGDLERIEALPSSQAPILAMQVDRRAVLGVGIDLFGFRFSVGPKARGRRASITFGPKEGLWLPDTAREELFDAVDKHGGERPLRATVVSLGPCHPGR